MYTTTKASWKLGYLDFIVLSIHVPVFHIVVEVVTAE
jgi:hypothetical protein